MYLMASKEKHTLKPKAPAAGFILILEIIITVAIGKSSSPSASPEREEDEIKTILRGGDPGN